MRYLGIFLIWCLFLIQGCGGETSKIQTENTDHSVAQNPTDKESKKENHMDNKPSETHSIEQNPNPKENDIIAANSRFAVDLYHGLRTQKGNLLFSPYSLSTVLTMTLNGANGETQAQLANGLHLVFPQEKLLPLVGTIQKELTKITDVDLNLANALWPADNFKLKNQFQKSISDHFDANLVPLDYAADSEAARVTINNWASKHTNGKIEQLINKGYLNQQTRMVLTNAIYFLGEWQFKFDKTKTQKDSFKLDSGKNVSVPMMHQTNSFKYFDDELIQILELPYMGHQTSMTLILPQKNTDLATIEKQLTEEQLKKWLSNLRPFKTKVALPKFKLGSTFELKEQLKALGIKDAFDMTKADFSNMAESNELRKGGGLYISAVIHQAMADVNETGTEAAAASAVIMKGYSASMEMKEFVANHPFLVIIRDKRAGTILFIGRVSDPTSAP